MKTKLLIYFFLFIGLHNSLADDKKKDDYLKYFKLVAEAQNLHKNKHYKEAVAKYEDAFNAVNGKADTNDRYDVACSSALANDLDKAFKHLFYIATKNEYSKLNHLKNNENLSVLHNDKRWGKLLLIVEKNRKEKEKKFDMQLIDKLDTIYEDDQNCRAKFEFALKKYKENSKEFQQIKRECMRIDSINQIKISKILDNRGWLGKDVIGSKGNLTLFLILQHADNNINMQLKYLPLLKKAVLNGKANPEHFAMFEDRIRINQGKKQIYGTQIGKDKKTGKYFVEPLEDPLNVDKRRKEVGLGNIADYVKQWGINWAPKQE